MQSKSTRQFVSSFGALLLLGGAAGAALLLTDTLGSQTQAVRDVADHRGPDSGNDNVHANAHVDGQPGGFGEGAFGFGQRNSAAWPGRCGYPLPGDFGLGFEEEVVAVQLDGMVTFEVGLGTFRPIPYGNDTPGLDRQNVDLPVGTLGTRDAVARRRTIDPQQMGPIGAELEGAGVAGSVGERGVTPRRQTIEPPQMGPIGAELEGAGLAGSVGERGLTPRRQTIVPPQEGEVRVDLGAWDHTGVVGERGVAPRRRTIDPAQMGPIGSELESAGVTGSVGERGVSPRRRTIEPPQWVRPGSVLGSAGMAAGVVERGLRPRRMTIIPPKELPWAEIDVQVQEILVQAAVVSSSGEPASHGVSKLVRGPGTPATMPDPPKGADLILPLPDGGKIQLLLRAAYVLDGGRVVPGEPVVLDLGGQFLQ